MTKDWDKICRDIPTPPDSDAEDELNVQKVKKNAQMISDVLHRSIPVLDPELSGSLPAGLNNLRDLTASLRAGHVPGRGTFATAPAPTRAASSAEGDPPSSASVPTAASPAAPPPEAAENRDPPPPAAAATAPAPAVGAAPVRDA